MFSTRFGTRSLVNVYKAADRTNYFTTPAPGQVVALQIGDLSLRTIGGKKPSKRAATTTLVDPNAGKLRLASADGAGKGAVEGVIVRVTPTEVHVAANGEEIPLGIFGPLGTLQSFGETNILYLSDEVPGALTPLNPAPGNWLRRVIRSPKWFSRLTAEEVNIDSPNAIYVKIIEEAALLI